MRVPSTAGEKKTLRASLERHRQVVLWKLDGLDEEQLRRPVLPSGWSMLGLVKHLASTEYGWFCGTFGRPSREVGEEAFAADADADWHLQPWETVEGVLAYYASARTDADAVVADLTLSARGNAWYGEEVSMRWVLVHMIEETARHAGHADVMRELLDGRTGDHPD